MRAGCQARPSINMIKKVLVVSILAFVIFVAFFSRPSSGDVFGTPT